MNLTGNPAGAEVPLGTTVPSGESLLRGLRAVYLRSRLAEWRATTDGGRWSVGGRWLGRARWGWRVERVFGDKDHRINPRNDLTTTLDGDRLRSSPQRGRAGAGP